MLILPGGGVVQNELGRIFLCSAAFQPCFYSSIPSIPACTAVRPTTLYVQQGTVDVVC